MGGKRKKKEKEKKDKLCSGGEVKSVSEDWDGERGCGESKGWEVLTRSFLPQQPFRLGNSQVMFTDRQKSLGKARDEKKKKKKAPTTARTQLQSAVSKCKINKTNKQKSCFPIVAPPSNFLQKKKGGKKPHTKTPHTKPGE